MLCSCAVVYSCAHKYSLQACSTYCGDCGEGLLDGMDASRCASHKKVVCGNRLQYVSSRALKQFQHVRLVEGVKAEQVNLGGILVN